MAAESYAALAARSLEEDVGRTLEVKGYGASRAAADPAAREALAALLVGAPGRPADADEGLARVASWAEATGDPVAEYVYGKNLANHEFWREAAEHLDVALRAVLPTPGIARELLKKRAVCACALGDDATGAAVRARSGARRPLPRGASGVASGCSDSSHGAARPRLARRDEARALGGATAACIVHSTRGTNVRAGEPMNVVTATWLFPATVTLCGSGFTSVRTTHAASAAHEFAMCTTWL